jgi:multiple sugar transport system substrate-binding protein
MSRARGRVATVVASVAVLVLSACGGGGGDGGGGGPQQITVWTGDTLPDRVAATEAITERFTQQTGIAVELVGVDEDQFNQLLTSAAAAGELPDVVGSQPLAAVRTLAANDLVDVEATAAVIEALGADSFDQRALELTREGEEQLAVPSDAWSQLLYYRRDLFQAAGLAPPTTYDEIRAARRPSTRAASPVSSAPPRPATRSPSRPSSTSRWPTAASWSTRRARSPSAAPGAWRRSSSTAT